MFTRRRRFLTALLLCLALMATTGGCGANTPTDSNRDENPTTVFTQQPDPTQPTQETQPAVSQDTTSTPEASKPDEESKTLTINPGDDLQSALDKVEDGYEIVINAGTYERNEPLLISEKTNLTIRGEGEGWIVCTDIYSSVLEIVDCSGVKLTNINACHKETRGELCLGEVVNVKRCREMVFEACEFNGCGSCGIFATGSEGIEITNCDIYQNSWVGIYLENTKDVILKDSRIVNNAGDIEKDDASDITMTGSNTLDNNNMKSYLSFVIDQGTASASLYYRRGRIYLIEMDDPDSAIPDFTKAIEKDPQFAEAYRDRGDAYLSKDMLEEAIEDLNKAYELYPTDGWLHNHYGTYYRKSGNYKKAAESFTKSMTLLLEVNPGEDMQWILLDRADCYKELGMKEEMIADLRASADLGNPYALEQLKALGLE